MDVSDIMTREVIYVSPEASVSEIAKIMIEYGVSGVPVVENDKILGIVTEEDLVMRDAIIDMPHFWGIFDSVFYLSKKRHDFEKEMHKILATTARDLMNDKVVTVPATASVQELATVMVKKEVNPVPVVGPGGELVGIVSRSDLVRLMVAEEEVGTDLEPPVAAIEDETVESVRRYETPEEDRQ